MLNLYHILDLEKGATADEVKKAFRIKARQYHPDLNSNPGAQEKFREVYMAYDILGNPDKRKFYDPMLDAHDGDEYLKDWRSDAYEQVDDISDMDYADFRRKKILIYMFSEDPKKELLIGFLSLIAAVGGLILFTMGYQNISDNWAVHAIHTGGVIGFFFTAISLNYLRVCYSNYQIIASDKKELHKMKI